MAMSDVPALREQAADLGFPSVQDGIDGVRFMLRCAESADADSRWVSLL